MTRFLRPAAFALSALLLAASAASAQEVTLKVGDKAPAFTPGSSTLR